MLEKEWTQLYTQLSTTRGLQTRFFSFVDTVSARNFAGTNDPHGWVGLRFSKLQPAAPRTNLAAHQHARSGECAPAGSHRYLGVNLIYTASYCIPTESFLAGLAQDVVKERIEIDCMGFGGQH